MAAAAVSASDYASFESCLRELRLRKRARKSIANLRVLRRGSPPREMAPASPVHDAADVRGLVTFLDNECWQQGLALIESAETRVAISTFTIGDHRGQLLGTIRERIRAGVEVLLIVSNSKRANGGPSTRKLIADLGQVGARVVECSNHSKCIVVDDEHVMIGSANLVPWHFGDVSMKFSSLRTARCLLERLDDIVASEPRSTRSRSKVA